MPTPVNSLATPAAAETITIRCADDSCYRQRTSRAGVHAYLASYVERHMNIRAANVLDRKRQACWENDDRNSAIARVAQAMRSCTIRTLFEHQLFLDADGAIPPNDDPSSCCILTEGLPHARRLHALLHDWDVVGVHDPFPERPHGREFDRIILTLSAAADLEMFAPAVLLVALGQTWLQGVPYYLPLAYRTTVLVDFADECDEAARRSTLARLSEYDSAGMTVHAHERWQTHNAAPASKDRT